MKSKLITVFAVLLGVTLGFCSLSQAGTDITQITSNSYEDSFPQIKGDYLVWQGQVDGDWEIFVYDIATGEGPVRITDNDYGDISSQTDGNYVVWLGFSYSGGEIFVYDIASGGTSQVTDDSNVELPNYPNVDSSPQIVNGRVAWLSHRVTDSVEPGNIFLYDVATGVTTQLSDNGIDDISTPRISDEGVVWLQPDPDDRRNYFIYFYDFCTGITSVVPGYIWEDPQSDGGLAVLAKHDGHDREIVVYNKCSRSYEQITDNDLEDRDPSISGNYVAWMAGEGEASEIFLVSGLPIVPCGDSGCDMDEDGVCGDVDNCPSIPNVGQEDSDGDGVGDVCDSCPNDPSKTDPGICGCGVADTDSDGDGTLDCNDGCDDDPNKTEPGVCGCGTPDTDSDGDGTLDCTDAFPDDPDEWLDTDVDGIGNNADLDDDNDDLPDTWEESYGLDPLDDTGDNGKDGDFDHDGWTNYQEFFLGSNPNDQNGVPVNSPPVADAGSDQTVNEGVLITLNGSNSSDPDYGDVLTYQWTQIDGDPVDLTDVDTAHPGFGVPDVGPSGAALTFRLTVTDTGGLYDTDECTVNVSWVNEAPTADGGDNQTVKEGSTVTLDGSNSADPDDGIASYLWEQTGGPLVTLSDTRAVGPTFVTPPVDPSAVSAVTLIFQLTVMDNGGFPATDKVSITISDNGITGFPDDVVTTTCSTDESVGLKVDTGGDFISLHTIDPSTIADATNRPDSLIYGLIDIQIKVTTPGDTATGTIYLATPAPEGYGWYKYSLTNGWTDYSAHAVFNATRDQVTLTWIDGGIGDDDGIANCVIVDPSGLGIAAATPESTPPAAPSDDGGNCFIATAAFGSYVDSHVQVLRDFRDEYLLTNMPGRWFVNIYYTYGPFWADLLNAYPGCKPFVRLTLMPLVGISYFVLNTSLATKLLTGFLLLGFIPICLLRINGRSVTNE